MNLPAGVSQREIDRFYGFDSETDLDACFEPDEEPTEEDEDEQ